MDTVFPSETDIYQVLKYLITQNIELKLFYVYIFTYAGSKNFEHSHGVQIEYQPE